MITEMSIRRFYEMNLIKDATNTMEQGEIIFMPVESFKAIDIETIKDYLDEISKNEKRFVAFIEPVNDVSSVNLHRLIDYDNLYRFYKNIEFEVKIDSRGNAEDKIRSVIKKFLNSSFEETSRISKFTEKMKEDNVIPYSYLQRMTSTAAGFKGHPDGATKVLKSTLIALCKNREIEEMSRNVTKTMYSTTQVCYRLIEQ